MEKYIITFEDKPSEIEDGAKCFKCMTAPWFVASKFLINHLTPYTEPDLGQVRQEAYKKGLADAWEAARKISFMPSEEVEQIFPGAGKYNRFNLGYSGAEVISRLAEHEARKEQEIKVGDEVEAVNGIAVVTHVGPRFVYYTYGNGMQGSDYMHNVKKTGRHFPEIIEALKKMREENDD